MTDFDPAMPYDDNDIIVGGKTLWAEARGETHDGQLAVAWVLRNRADRSAFAGTLASMPGALASICLAPWQFSCWNDDGTAESQRNAMEALPGTEYPDQHDMMVDVADGVVADLTGGADHYFTVAKPPDVAAWPPAWAKSMRSCGQFGTQVFYDSHLGEGVHALYEGCPFTEQVKLLQSALKTAGFYSGALDGDFGAETLTAVEDFQTSKKLSLDGVVGNDTRKALGIA